MTYRQFLVRAVISMASNPAFGSAGFHAKKSWSNEIISAALELSTQLERRHFKFDPDPEDGQESPHDELEPL